MNTRLYTGVGVLNKYRILILKSALFVTLISVLSLFVFYLSNNYLSIKNTIVLATTVKPETFTELYFDDHTSLSTSIKDGGKYAFSFTIHNLENKDMRYTYVIYLQKDTSDTMVFNPSKISTVLYTDSIFVKKDDYVTMTKNIGPLPNYRSKLIVELVNKKQSINFWLNPL